MRSNEEQVGKVVHYKGKVTQVQNVFGKVYVLRVGMGNGPYYYGDINWVNLAIALPSLKSTH